jgi:hypothetical protein
MDTANDRPAGLQIGTPEQFRWLHGIAKTVLLLNLLDAVFTLYWVYSGLAEEANPLMRELLRRPLLFMAIKLALVSAGSWLLWRHRERASAVIAIFVVFLVYYAILVHHLGFLGEVIRALA